MATMTFQQETNTPFILPPCKDIIRDAAGGNHNTAHEVQEPRDSTNLSVGSSPHQMYRAISSHDHIRGDYSRPQSSYAQSLSASSSSPVSPKFSSCIRYPARRRESSINQYHPYKKEHSYTASHGNFPLPGLKPSLDHRTPSLVPRSPPNTRKSSFAASDSSASFGRTGFLFTEEDMVSTPLTPLTQHSEENQNPKEDAIIFDTSLVQRYPQSQDPMNIGKQSSELAKAARRRKAHLQSEQRRREHIKDGMDQLVQIVPACQESRDTKGISKAAILKHAYEYIYQLRTDLQSLKQINNSKDREIAELHRRLALSNPGLPTHWRPSH